MSDRGGHSVACVEGLLCGTRKQMAMRLNASSAISSRNSCRNGSNTANVVCK